MNMLSFFQRLSLVILLCGALATDAGAQSSTSANHGAIGFGSWNTTAEFKDVVVSSNGVVLYRSDFAKTDTNGLTILRGHWSVTNGVLRQSAIDQQCRVFIGDRNWANYTVNLRARSTGGQEGFTVYFNTLDGNNWTWFNVAGWSNTLAGVNQQIAGGSFALLCERDPLKIETNVWYDVRVVLDGPRIQCYVNSNLVQTAVYSNAPAPVNEVTVSAPAALPPTTLNASGPVARGNRNFPFGKPPISGAIGVGCWNTLVEIKSIVVTSNDVTLYQSDFEKDTIDSWNIAGGTWSISDGVLRQSDMQFPCFATTGDTNWANYTLTVQVRKTGGDEGFFVVFGWRDNNNTLYLNAGGWGNRQAVIEQRINGREGHIAEVIPLSVETNKWHEVKVVLTDGEVSCFLDSNLLEKASAQVTFSTNAVYLGSSPAPDGHVLKFRAGRQEFQAGLTKDRGGPPALEVGSLVCVTGQLLPDTAAAPPDSAAAFEFQVSPSDVVLIKPPSWWTWRRILWFGGTSSAIVTTAAIWIAMISRKNRLLTLAQGELQKVNDELEMRVEKRTADLAKAHEQLMEASRAAGMAEVATGILHNVGNVLNSVNVSTTLLKDQLRNSKITSVGRAATLMKDHAAELGDFVANDPKGQQLPEYLWKLSVQLESDRAQALEELAGLQINIEHIKQIVAMQQDYAGVAGVTTIVKIPELIEDVLRLADSNLTRHGVQVVKEAEQNLPDICMDRHKALQILINLVRNAKQACIETGSPDKKLTLRATAPNGRINISVSDNGVGIPAENLTLIFAQGFTTRKNGHGFGLHSSALAAKDIGGRLFVQSEGPGKGATFTLELTPNLGRTN
jgi:signal transduction histidine kinase/alpha-L-arabinofuranosidase